MAGDAPSICWPSAPLSTPTSWSSRRSGPRTTAPRERPPGWPTTSGTTWWPRPISPTPGSTRRWPPTLGGGPPYWATCARPCGSTTNGSRCRPPRGTGHRPVVVGAWHCSPGCRAGTRRSCPWANSGATRPAERSSGAPPTWAALSSPSTAPTCPTSPICRRPSTVGWPACCPRSTGTPGWPSTVTHVAGPPTPQPARPRPGHACAAGGRCPSGREHRLGPPAGGGHPGPGLSAATRQSPAPWAGDGARR